MKSNLNRISNIILEKSMKPYFTAVIEKEDNMFVALCPELDVASQGLTIEEAKQNLKEAVELFFEFASETEILSR